MNICLPASHIRVRNQSQFPHWPFESRYKNKQTQEASHLKSLLVLFLISPFQGKSHTKNRQ